MRYIYIIMVSFNLLFSMTILGNDNKIAVTGGNLNLSNEHDQYMILKNGEIINQGIDGLKNKRKITKGDLNEIINDTKSNVKKITLKIGSYKKEEVSEIIKKIKRRLPFNKIITKVDKTNLNKRIILLIDVKINEINLIQKRISKYIKN